MNTDFDRHGLFACAAAFAAYAHDGQYSSENAVPEIVHCMETAAIAATMTNDQEVLAAAVLHETHAFCDVTEEELRIRFGKRIARLVCAFADGGTTQKELLIAVNRLREAPRETLILTLSDELSCLRSLARTLRAGAAPNLSVLRWYYVSIGQALAPLRNTDAYREFSRLTAEIFHETLPD